MTPVQEIGARMGRAIAKGMLSDGPDFFDVEWPGLDPLDPDIYDDELDAVGIKPGSAEFKEAEAAAAEAYRQTMHTCRP